MKVEETRPNWPAFIGMHWGMSKGALGFEEVREEIDFFSQVMTSWGAFSSA